MREEGWKGGGEGGGGGGVSHCSIGESRAD